MKKDIVIFIGVVLIFGIVIFITDFQSVESYNSTSEKSASKESVTLSVRCDSVLDYMDKLDESLRDYIPKDGVILKESEYPLEEGDTVFDILCFALKKEGIAFEFQNANENLFHSTYIEGINYLYEFSCSSSSGWLYLVNGEYPSCGCSDYKLKNGDKIQWIYTCDMSENALSFINGGEGD